MDKKLKIGVCSDLHYDFFRAETAPVEELRVGVDLLIVAGDLAEGNRVAMLAGLADRVVYVTGNHEYYQHDFATLDGKIAESAKEWGIDFLQRKSVVVGGVRVLGCTLWTDYFLNGPEDGEHWSKYEARRGMNDFVLISAGERVFTPDDAQEKCLGDVRWLCSELEKSHDGPTVVVTHHGPSPKSVHPKYASEQLMNAGYTSNLEWVMEKYSPALWVHGHTHVDLSYKVGSTSVVCHPRGYPSERKWDNAGVYRPLILEI